MRTLYFDCFAGASGDMILGALVNAGAPPEALLAQLAQLGVENYRVEFEIVDRSGISATYARVETAHEHRHRHLKDIHQIIQASQLNEAIKTRAAQVFTRLAEAEARVHNTDINRIHFHEVGALDAIIDVVGACIGFELLGVERFVSSPLHVGSGMVEMAHGRFPVPPPAVAELLREAPTYGSNIPGELVTPTGAAIISTVCAEYGPLPHMKIERTGYGAGTRQYEKFPNVLRVMLGEGRAAAGGGDSTVERLLMLETNVDDMSPQQLGYVMEQAFAQGALDCYFTSVQMKKNRPGVLVSILCQERDRERFTALLFAETTTLGVRSCEVERRALAREIVRVKTPYGEIDVKVGRTEAGEVKVMPEYEQCREAALKTGLPLREVEGAARRAYEAGARAGREA